MFFFKFEKKKKKSNADIKFCTQFKSKACCNSTTDGVAETSVKSQLFIFGVKKKKFYNFIYSEKKTNRVIAVIKTWFQ